MTLKATIGWRGLFYLAGALNAIRKSKNSSSLNTPFSHIYINGFMLFMKSSFIYLYILYVVVWGTGKVI